MIRNTITLLMILTSSLLFSQINSVQRGPCFKKSADRIGDKYAQWECDERDKIVDCNQELESDPGANLVFLRKSGDPYSGDCESCHMNGLRERLVHFESGKVNGIDTTYYTSGCPQVVRNHISGVENGRWTFYNDTSGLVAWHINYLEGIKHGPSIYFKQRKVGDDKYRITVDGVEHFIEYAVYENDTVKVENYINGVLDGVRKDYGPNSKLKLEVSYKNGLFDGAFIEYGNEGNVLQERFYKAGQKVGDWKYYYNDGNLLKTESWNNDIKEGTFKTFYIQGHIQTLENYRKGEKHGEFMERFPDDKLKRQAFYKKGELIEDHVYDQYGNEIETVGGDTQNNKEDDAVPTTKTKKWWQFWKKG